jgi:hypothetical protein
MRFIWFVLLLPFSFLVNAQAVLIVDSPSGELQVNGACTLRGALTAAMTHVPQGGCAAPKADQKHSQIVLLLDRSTPIVLGQPDSRATNAGLPQIAAGYSIELIAEDAVVERNRAWACTPNGVTEPGEFRLVEVVSGASLLISGVTLHNGCIDGAGLLKSSGGAILNLGSLELDRVVLSSNTAYMLGGAVYASGSTNAFSRVDVQSNKAQSGAGIAGSGARLSIFSSLIRDNSTVERTAINGQILRGYADAIFANRGAGSSVLNLVNSTVSGNAPSFVATNLEFPQSAVATDGTDTRVEFSTIAANAAVGLATRDAAGSGSQVLLNGAVLADNSGGNCDFGGVPRVTGGPSVAGSASCVDVASGDVIADPELAPLASGGGFLPTHGPSNQSPVRDTTGCALSSGSMLIRDARDRVRPVGPRCDAGAVEITTPLPDLTVEARDSVAGVSTTGSPWVWAFTLSTSNAEVRFGNGATIFSASLPTANIQYGTPMLSAGFLGAAALSCNVAAGLLSCQAAGDLSFPANTSVTVTIQATAAAPGSYALAPLCAIDPGNHVPETDEGNNVCSSMVNVVSTDLTVSLADSRGGVATIDETWDWEFVVSATRDTQFADGATILVADLPRNGLILGAPFVKPINGIPVLPACIIANSRLTCRADGAFTMPAGAALRVTLHVMPTAPGSYQVPDSGGVCGVDPEGTITEADESNNRCADAVTVTARPDLTVVASDSVGGSVVAGAPFVLHMTIRNANATANFAAGMTVFQLDLPPEASYFRVDVSGQSGVSATPACNFVSYRVKCVANSLVSFSANGTLSIDIYVIANEAGTYSIPAAGGRCAVDPEASVDESNESNNDCSSNINVAASALPDLSVKLSNDRGGTVSLGESWTWKFTVTATMDVTFADGTSILVANLPGSGMIYGAPVVQPIHGISNLPACALNNTTMTCFATTPFVVPAGSSLQVEIQVTPTLVGSYRVPDANGMRSRCALDPDNVVAEATEFNNSCADSVAVVDLGGMADLAVSVHSVAETYVVGVPWQWLFRVHNAGNSSATFPAGATLLHADLPPGLVYENVSFQDYNGLFSLSCGVSNSRLDCVADAGLDVGPNAELYITVTARSLSAGNYSFPASGGTCAADPSGLIQETDEANNNCSASFVVLSSPVFKDGFE